MTSDRVRRWHRLFGIALADLFRGTGWEVELEKELALRSQLLDVAIIRRDEGGLESPTGSGLPDGLEGLRSHNLVTYKSQHEALDNWAIQELISHYVTYRKLVSPRHRFLPETLFGLYSVSVRKPHDLLLLLRETRWPGIFDLVVIGLHIRVVIPGAVEPDPRNAVWSLFSSRPERLRAGLSQFPARHPGTRALLRQLFHAYRLEVFQMPYTMEQFLRESEEEMETLWTEEDRAAFMRLFPLEDRLRGLGADDVLKGLSKEELAKLRDRLNKPT